MIEPDLATKAKSYADSREIQIKFDRPLGGGTDGSVWPTDRNSAVKALRSAANYATELRCYQRLMEHGVEVVDSLTVPRLIDHDDELLVIEMEIVEPPYLLDFGKAYIDEPSPYTSEQLAEWEESWADFFPEQDLRRVRKVLRILRSHGIEYVDPKPSNIRFHAVGSDE